MTQIHFYDDTEELLVWNAVDVIIQENSMDSAFYDAIEWYDEIIDMINEIVVIVDTDSFMKRDEMVENYKEAIKKYIQTNLQDYFLSKIKVEFYKITVPLKVYLIINIKWSLKIALDNLWYYKNLNTKTVNLKFTADHNNLIEKYADFYTKLICKCSISTHYFFCPDIYKMLKEEFQYLEDPNIREKRTIGDYKVPQLRELLRALECYNDWKKVQTLSRPRKFVSSIIKEWACKIVKEEWEPQNYTFNYIIFSLLFLKRPPLIVITKDYSNVELWIWYELYLTDTDSLIKDFVKTWSDFLVINPFQRIEKIVEEDTDEKWKDLLKEQREKYQEFWEENCSLDEKLDKCKNFMKQKLKEYDKIEFMVTTKHNEPYWITQIVTQCDPKKFHSTEESFSNPVKVTSIKQWKKQRRIYKSTKPLSEI